MPSTLDATSLVVALRAMLAAVREHEDELNRINVFPVPDADTGTNLVATLDGIVATVGPAPPATLRALAVAVGEGGLQFARGNSGMIVAQALRGLCDAWAGRDAVGPAELAAGFRAASDAAAEVVLEPVEGTILTVARETAAALEATEGGDLDGLLKLAARAAGDAVAATTGQLPALREAGVVDAAGRGYQLCVEALAAVAAGEGAPPDAAPHAAAAPAAGRGDGPAFEVQYLLPCSAAQAGELRRALGTLGGSVVVAGGSGRYSVHVHTDDAGAAIEAGLRYGRPTRIQIVHLAGAR